jgi:hypothetical protein
VLLPHIQNTARQYLLPALGQIAYHSGVCFYTPPISHDARHL